MINDVPNLPSKRMYIRFECTFVLKVDSAQCTWFNDQWCAESTFILNVHSFMSIYSRQRYDFSGGKTIHFYIFHVNNKFPPELLTLYQSCAITVIWSLKQVPWPWFVFPDTNVIDNQRCAIKLVNAGCKSGVKIQSKILYSKLSPQICSACIYRKTYRKAIWHL